jgi:hypothetical protein
MTIPLYSLFYILLINYVYLPYNLTNPEYAKCLLYDNLILGEECDPIPPPPIPLLPLSGRCRNEAAVVVKARWLTQHGGPPGWLEESDPTAVIFACLFRTVPVALTGAARMRRELTEFPAGVIL